MGVRRAGQAQREARVMAAAQELFLAKGYDRTSMREIAQLAGVSVGTVANTGKKAELLGGLFSSNDTSALLGRVASLETGSGGGTLADEMGYVFASWFDGLAQGAELVRDFLLAALSRELDGHEARRAEDGAVLHALTRRVLHHHPSLELWRAHGLAVAVYSLHATMVLATLIEGLPVEEARNRARLGTEAVLAGL